MLTKAVRVVYMQGEKYIVIVVWTHDWMEGGGEWRALTHKFSNTDDGRATRQSFYSGAWQWNGSLIVGLAGNTDASLPLLLWWLLCVAPPSGLLAVGTVEGGGRQTAGQRHDDGAHLFPPRSIQPWLGNAAGDMKMSEGNDVRDNHVTCSQSIILAWQIGGKNEIWK